MSFYKMMRIINKLMNAKIEYLNKEDTEVIFEHDANYELKDALVYLGCKVVKVADLFNVTLPEEKFSREELQRAKRVEELYY